MWWKQRDHLRHFPHRLIQVQLLSWVTQKSWSGIGRNNFPTSSFGKRCGFCSIATSVRRAVAVNSICFSIKGWQSKSLKYYSTTSLDTFPLCKRIWPQVGLQSSFCISWCLILNISQNSFLFKYSFTFHFFFEKFKDVKFVLTTADLQSRGSVSQGWKCRT